MARSLKTWFAWVYLKTKARNRWPMGSMFFLYLLFSEWAKESKRRKAEERPVVSFSLKQ